MAKKLPRTTRHAQDSPKYERATDFCTAFQWRTVLVVVCVSIHQLDCSPCNMDHSRGLGCHKSRAVDRGQQWGASDSVLVAATAAGEDCDISILSLQLSCGAIASVRRRRRGDLVSPPAAEFLWPWPAALDIDIITLAG